MNQVLTYIEETLDFKAQQEPVLRGQLASLPMYLGNIYKFTKLTLFNQPLLLAEPKDIANFSLSQTEKHFNLLKNALGDEVVLVLPHITALTRKRLIGKGINFIVPGTQLYLPSLLLDLRETFARSKPTHKRETLLPSAQFLLIYHLLRPYDKWQLEAHPFKDIASQTGYTPMAITKAVENLKYHELVDVKGDKEKYIHFRLRRVELWSDALHRRLLANPVLKQVYVDELPQKQFLLYSNLSALPEYSDMNPSQQNYYALEKTAFYALKKNKTLVNANEQEGRYCLEVWKYDPLKLVGEYPTEHAVVDPLSLYLSLKDNTDERIEMALEQILEKITW